MVRKIIQYYCTVCGRRYPNEKEALECEQKKPYPPDFAIGDECIITLSDGHKDNAYVCKITGMQVKGHIYVRLIEIVKKYSFPYEDDYQLSREDQRLYGPH